MADFLWPRRWGSVEENANAHIPVDVCIVNPPYQRIGSTAPETTAVSRQGLDYTGNVYTAFCELGWRSVRAGGQLAALTPRSFQNGKRFDEFRRRLQRTLDVDTVHVWRNRRTLFGTQDVIPETLCWHGRVKTGTETDSAPLVTVIHGDHERRTTWRWATNSTAKWRTEQSMRLRTLTDRNDALLAEWAEALPTIGDLGLHVETGRHVKSSHQGTLEETRQPGAVPYYWTAHIKDGQLRWPLAGEANWYRSGSNDGSTIRPTGLYVITNRFAPNDREPRARACALTETDTRDGFVASDSTNVIRSGTDTKHGHDRWTMLGLAAWINSAMANSLIDAQLGSTQLNADDLTSLSVPGIGDLHLIALRWPARLRTGDTAISDLLEHTMDRNTLRAARTIERLRG